jgi:hypothetical protein
MSVQQRRVLWPAIVAVAVTFTALLWVSASTQADEHSAPQPSHAPALPTVAESANPISLRQENSAQERVETELITIQPGGFEPAEITRPQGRIRLAVDNRSGNNEVLLRFEREASQHQHEFSIPGSKLDWREVMELQPGTYLLSEANHPEWVCRITITAR